MARLVKQNIGVKIRADYVTRLRSIGLGREQIEKMDMYLAPAIDNVNDADKYGRC